MDIDILAVPYDSAHRGARMGAGPEALLAAGLPARLERYGHSVRTVVIEPPHGSWQAEIRTAFDLARALALAVGDARENGRLPLVVTGNCFAAVGVCAGLGAEANVLWADAHADFNTPETTVGGFLDGMALATLTGHCWANMTGRVPGFRPVAEERVRLLGTRDLDPLEISALDRSRIRRVPASEIDRDLGARLTRELGGDRPLYLHMDLDVLDPSSGRANEFAAPGGVSADNLAAFCDGLRLGNAPAAITISAYDPAADVTGGIRDAALRAVDALLGEVGDARQELGDVSHR